MQQPKNWAHLSFPLARDTATFYFSVFILKQNPDVVTAVEDLRLSGGNDSGVASRL